MLLIMTPALISSLVQKTSFDYIHFLLHTGTLKSTCCNLVKNLTNADLDFFFGNVLFTRRGLLNPMDPSVDFVHQEL